MAVRSLPPFAVVRAHAEVGTCLELHGELDMNSAPRLTRELRRIAEDQPGRVVLDLAALSFMDVAGLRAILDAARDARRDGRSLVVANPLPHIVRLLELTAIDQTLEVQGRPLASVR